MRNRITRQSGLRILKIAIYWVVNLDTSEGVYVDV